MCPFLSQNGALWDMGLVLCGLCSTSLLNDVYWRMWVSFQWAVLVIVCDDLVHNMTVLCCHVTKAVAYFQCVREKHTRFENDIYLLCLTLQVVALYIYRAGVLAMLDYLSEQLRPQNYTYFLPRFQWPLLLTLIPAWINNHMLSKIQDEITYSS